MQEAAFALTTAKRPEVRQHAFAVLCLVVTLASGGVEDLSEPLKLKSLFESLFSQLAVTPDASVKGSLMVSL